MFFFVNLGGETAPGVNAKTNVTYTWNFIQIERYPKKGTFEYLENHCITN